MVGIFDLATNVTEGIRNTTMVFDEDELERVRYPRFIPPDGIIKVDVKKDVLRSLLRSLFLLFLLLHSPIRCTKLMDSFY